MAFVAYPKAKLLNLKIKDKMSNEAKKNNNTKPICAVLMLLIWSIATLLLGISVVGWVALAMMLNNSDWFSIPNKCVKSIEGHFS